MKTLGSVAAVVAAIREEANAAIERLEQEAAREIASLARPPAVVTADPESDSRVASARARAHDRESQEEWNAGLEDLQDRERWMNRVVAAGRAAFADASDPAAVKRLIAALVKEAAAQLPDGACVVVVPAAIAAHLDDGWRVQTSGSIGRQVSVEAGPVAAGCIVRLVDRPMAYDNSVEGRERRTQVEWRAALARVYAEALSRIEVQASAAVGTADAAEVHR
jgi:vacuolar-type H+-ATPase subunit E/Vma4